MTTYRPDPDNPEVVIGENGHQYPSNYYPGQGDPVLDEIWRMLDILKPGALSMEARSLLAGMIWGAMHAQHRALKYTLSTPTDAKIEAMAKALYGDGWETKATTGNKKYCREKAKLIYSALMEVENGKDEQSPDREPSAT